MPTWFDGQLQCDLFDLFEQQANDFLKDDHERVAYVPKQAYRIERGEIYVLKGISLSAAMEETILKPHQADNLSLASPLTRKSIPPIATIFAAEPAGRVVNRVLFQQFRSPQLLDRKFTLQWSGTVFNQLSNNGLSLAHDLAAIWAGGDKCREHCRL